MRTVLIWLLCCAPALAAEKIDWHSGDQRVALVELYTSEGCSSCPPADRFLSSLSSRDGLFHQFIPLAFHVDYWDYLGWRDRFANADYSLRQRRYAAAAGLRSVYTPAMVIGGHEWRGLLRGQRGFTEAVDSGRDAVGDLSVSGTLAALQLHYAGALPPQARVNWAWFGMGLRTEVAAGENRGRQLEHDFVVLDWQHRPLSAASTEVTVPAAPQRGQQHTGLAIWISAGNNPAPLQAVAGLVGEGNAVP